MIATLPPFVREHLAPLGWAAGLHVGLIVFLSVSFALNRPPVVPVRLMVKATVIDESALRALRAREERERLEEQRRRQEEAAQARREAERLEEQRRQQEQARQAEIERQRRIETEQARQAEERREAETRRVAEERRREEEARQAEEARRAEQRRQAEEARQAEERRRAEERRQAEAVARRQAELEADLAAQLELEERRLQAERAGLLGQYIALIQQRVTRNWIRPPEARPGIDCEVFVTQIPGGEVVGVRFGRCNGDEVVRRSIEAAVFRSSPLPKPPDPTLFERNLVFDFRPE